MHPGHKQSGTLVVVCHDVVYTDDARHRREAAAGAVGPLPIVAVDEGGEGGSPLPLARVGARILPLLREHPVHSLHLPVLPGAEGPGVPVLDACRLQPAVEQRRAVPVDVH